MKQKKCKHCKTNVENLAIHQGFCSEACRTTYFLDATKKPKLCLWCQKNIDHMAHNATTCSQHCWEANRLNIKNQGDEGIDFITCPVCSTKVRQFSTNHAKKHGYKNAADMQEHLNMPSITCEKLKESYQGENNPGYQHGGKFSAWSKNFKNGYSAEAHEKQKERQREVRKEHPEKFMNQFEYWLKEADGDHEKAKEMHTKFQTRDLAFFIDKYGEEEGIRRHREKTEKWMKSYTKTNYSKVSQELFKGLLPNIVDISDIYFATHTRKDMTKYVNKEYILSVGNTYVRPDFISLNRKKIIEFDGDYWHSEAVANPEREENRDRLLMEAGYDVLHVKECDYKADKTKVINQCLIFLKQ